MAYWFFLSDPEDYPLQKLFERPNRTDVWDGVFGAAAQKYIGEIRQGDRIAGYHTAPDKQVVALLEAVTAPYQNPKVKDKKNWVVDVKGVEQFAHPVALKELKANPRLAGMKLFHLVRPIAVSPLTEAEFSEIVAMARGK